MIRLIDRYLAKEILVPLALGLVVFTFVLELPPLLKQGEQLISKGVPLSLVFRALLRLLPQALSITIPMALLLGILVGLGRLSADREFVALQACGVSLFRFLRPIVVIAAVATAATAYETIVALPDANQSFREMVFQVVADRVETNVKPRVFFEDFPNRVLYVKDLPASGGWRGVFLADTSNPDKRIIYFAREGRIVVDRAAQSVVLQLSDASQHTTSLARPDEYEGARFEHTNIGLDPQSVFPAPPPKGAPEMTIAQLWAKVEENEQHGLPSYAEYFMIQQKFSLPLACPVLALIGLALGASNRKDGRLAGFVIGVGVIFAYYVLLFGARTLAMGGRFSPSLAPWIPNIVLGAVGIALTLWRARSADQPIRIAIPVFWRRRAAADAAAAAGSAAPRRQVVLVVRLPHLNLPRPRLLDLYVSQQYVRIFVLGFAALLAIFYISTFMDLADKVFRGSATLGMLASYFYYITPQYVYYIIPMSALLAVLVTIGLMTKNSELVVMKACGVSLYRSSAPLVLFALVASGVLFGLQEYVLSASNRQAERLNGLIRGFPTRTFGVLNRRWIVASNGGQTGNADIYHYDFFDPRANHFSRLSIYRFDRNEWRLASLTHAKDVRLVQLPSVNDTLEFGWKATEGWTREFEPTPAGAERSVVKYQAFAERMLTLEPPRYFKTEQPETDQMTFAELRAYISHLRTSGVNVVPQMVDLQRKVAFPLVTLVMTMLAVPFAVTTGRRGALYGIGIGIVLAISYWIMMSVFAAMGAGGLVAPMVAAWAPNVLFGAAAIYMVLTVRT